MSETSPPPVPPPPPGPPQYVPPPPSQRSGCATAFMVLVGIILLLPGLCALVFSLDALSSTSHLEPVILLMVLLGLAVGFAGVMLIYAAFKRR